MDNSGSEFVFLHEFFRDPRKNRKVPLAELAPVYVFNEIFDPTFKLIQVCLQYYTNLFIHSLTYVKSLKRHLMQFQY